MIELEPHRDTHRVRDKCSQNYRSKSHKVWADLGDFFPVWMRFILLFIRSLFSKSFFEIMQFAHSLYRFRSFFFFFVVVPVYSCLLHFDPLPWYERSFWCDKKENCNWMRESMRWSVCSVKMNEIRYVCMRMCVCVLWCKNGWFFFLYLFVNVFVSFVMVLDIGSARLRINFFMMIQRQFYIKIAWIYI